MNIEFNEWLNNELAQRGWSQSDLARAAGLGRGTISNILNNTRSPGTDAINAIAKALRLPPELVLRKAGLLPPVSEYDELEEQVRHGIARLTGPRRRMALDFIRFLESQQATEEGETKP